MTQALPERDTTGLDLDPASVRLLRELQLAGLLEDVATIVGRRHGVTHLIVDRGSDPDAAHISAVVDGLDLVDLWDLDPMLWDDANWAAVRLLPFGELTIVRPRA